MKIGAFQKISLIDYPGKISSVIFAQGCNFRCWYCHNPQLVLTNLFEKPLREKIIFDYFEKRRRTIEGAVITGGEPTIHEDLSDFIKRIKRFGFSIKLDTNGSNPKILEKILKENLIDFVAMDIKASFKKYNIISGIKVELKAVLKSIELIKFFNINHMFRITFIEGFHTHEDIYEINKLINEDLVIQKFSPALFMIKDLKLKSEY